MFSVGDTVRVLPPFAEYFSGTYVVSEVVSGEDGSTTYILAGAEGGFDAIYLELAA
jgi:hypothetical protein